MWAIPLAARQNRGGRHFPSRADAWYSRLRRQSATDMQQQRTVEPASEAEHGKPHGAGKGWQAAAYCSTDCGLTAVTCMPWALSSLWALGKGLANKCNEWRCKGGWHRKGQQLLGQCVQWPVRIIMCSTPASVGVTEGRGTHGGAAQDGWR